jgi:hypothetical protein
MVPMGQDPRQSTDKMDALENRVKRLSLLCAERKNALAMSLHMGIAEYRPQQFDFPAMDAANLLFGHTPTTPSLSTLVSTVSEG